MLKTTRSSEILAPKSFRAGDNKVVKVDGKADETFKNLSKSKKSKNEKSEVQTYIGATKEPIFLIPGAKKAFN